MKDEPRHAGKPRSRMGPKEPISPPTSENTEDTGAVGLYSRLLLLLPRSLRTGFEEEMAFLFQRRLRDARGPLGRAGVWVRGLGDLLGQGVSELFLRRGRGGRGVGIAQDEGSDGGAGEVRAARRGSGRIGAGLLTGEPAFVALGGDLRFGIRALRRRLPHTLVAAFTLAIAIGGATVAFSLVKGVLLRPLPFPGDEELAVIRQLDPDGEEQILSFPNFDDFRSEARSLQGIAALRFPHGTTILGGGEPASGVVVPVSREFFSLLGVSPFLGRAILWEENRPGGDPVAVVGYEYWSRFLGSEERLDGLRITVEGISYAVVGVMPPGFKVLEDADVYLPLERNPQRIRDSSNYRGIGRLAEGATLLQARTELNGIARRLEEAYPDEARLSGVTLRPLREELLGAVTRPLFLLLGASGILLLLACTNVASMLMARSVTREREMAVRSALGGRRSRLIRLAVTESLLLAGLAGFLGVGLTMGTLESLKLLGADFIPRLATVSLDASVLAFALGATLATSVLFGLLPALRIPEPGSSLRSGALGNSRGRRGIGWSLLVGGQVALAVSLVVASGLLLRSMREILSADTHFRPDGVLTVGLDFTSVQSVLIRGGQVRLGELKEEWLALPGVTDVGFVSYLPTNRGMMTGTVYRPPLPTDGFPEHMAGPAGWRVVYSDYFQAMGIPLREGRFFQAQDGPDSPPVIILNEPLARALFPDGDAVGSFVGFEPFWRDVDLEVVGVVAEARDWRVPAGEQMEGFVLASQRPGYARFLTAAIHTSGDPVGLIGPARERLRAFQPGIPGNFRTMEAIVSDSFRDRTFTLGVLGVFALLSLFLSAVGIYGVVSYTVSARAREIGIMLALGAGAGRLRRQVFLGAARPVVLGLGSGVGLALVSGRLLETLLFQVSPRDPLTLAAAPLVLFFAASLAILLPVFRHTRVDPAGSMREE
ncbi:MAG: ABC transporter permease [Longimicrobiales bacterium]